MDKLILLLIGSGIVIISGAIIIFNVESGHPDAQINSWIDAAWWTVATVTTVGYGDVVPVTDTGRIIAIFYMLFGITMLGISLSVLSTRFYQKKFKEDKEITHGQKIILDKIEQLEQRHEKLQKDLKDTIEKQKEKK